jgi:hypothetical protein
MERYREALRQLTARKNQELQKRVRRCEYLRLRLNTMVRCGNREQAEAYTRRINQHKPRLLSALEEVAALEEILKKIT